MLSFFAVTKKAHFNHGQKLSAEPEYADLMQIFGIHMFLESRHTLSKHKESPLLVQGAYLYMVNPF